MLSRISRLRRRGGENINITQIAQAHYDRVVADGGTLPSLSKLTDFLTDYYAIRKTAKDTNILCDPHLLGYKLSSNKLTKLYDLTGDDFYQQTSENMPLFQTWDSANGNYWINASGASGNYIISETLTLSSVGDTDLIFKIDVLNTNTLDNYIYNRVSCIRAFVTNNTLRVWFWVNGTTTTTSTINVVTGVKWYRIKRNATTGDVSYYTSTDVAFPTNWTFVVTRTGLLAGNLGTGTQSAYIGSNSCRHKIYEVRLYTGHYDNGGTLVDHFTPNAYNPAISETQFSDSSLNRLFTITRDANATGVKADIIYRNTAQFDGIAHSIGRAIAYDGYRTDYYTAQSPNSYEITTELQRIGYKIDAYKITKSAMLMSVKKSDSSIVRDAMQTLYNNYYLNSDFFFSVRLYGQSQELEQEIEYNQ